MPPETPITFESEGQQVVGIWHEPASRAQPAPAVILCHGFTGHKAESHRIFVETARALAQAGIGALRFDFRGSGDSEGESVDVTVAGEVLDLRAALAWTRSKPGVDPTRVGLLGLSMGGLVTALTVGEENVKAHVLWNPLLDAAGVAERRRTEKSDLELQASGVVDYNGWAVGLPFLMELPMLAPQDEIVKSGAPLLIVLGDRDESVHNEEGYAYERVLREAGRDVTLHVVQGGGHTFESRPAKAEAIRHTVEWLSDRL